MARAPQILGERFEIEHRIGAGGAGTIYRARDRATNAPVAVKLLQQTGPRELARFEREAAVLAGLRHPRVVRYVAHGSSDDEQPYLVMEWLDGEDLSARLRRAQLSGRESVRLVARIADVATAVHARGVVHRDLKPSNLFLVGGRLDDVTLIDFGLARFSEGACTLTSLDAAVGTPGYMAPEQVRGERGIDHKADVFALGCVLFRCLTGQAPFVGGDLIAVLAKIVLEEAPPLRELRPDLPERLEALVASMLHKSPAARPTDAELARALDAVAREVGDAPGPQAGVTQPRPHLTGSEQRLCSVLLVDAADLRGGAPLGSDGGEGRDALLAGALREYGATFSRLLDGTCVVALTGAGAATDQAARAARCALAVHAILPTAPLSLATGRGVVSGDRILGEAIDRAAGLIDHARRAPVLAAGRVWIDELTAGLLGASFRTSSEDGRRVLVEEGPTEGAPALLGRRTPCVGRQQELAMLEGVFEKTVSEPTAQAVVVTAPAGVGKSRLLHELLARRRALGEPFELWLAQGDPMRAGTPFGLLVEVLEAAAGITDGEPLDARHRKLTERVARHVGAEHGRRVTEFLGEMMSLPFPGDESVALRAARHDTRLMSDQMQLAWVDFAAAECRAQPVLLVLEDLHWGDAPTVEMIDVTLRLLHDAPLMVLALGRLELSERFPDLWGGRSCTAIRLSELSRRACEALATAALGPGASAATVARVYEGSAGNAFLLEELLRAAAEGRDEQVPGTVVAMVQSRLVGLDAVLRLVLRAGSVLGRVFRRGALVALLGDEVPDGVLDATLAELERREWIVRRRASSREGEREYAYRHALVRDAAYGMLTDEDRVLGHRLAGEWLEAAGETDAAVLAEHFARGEARERAVRWYLAAGRQALAGSDLGAAISHASRAMELGARGEMLGDLALVRAEAHGWRGENAECDRWARLAMAELPSRGLSWYAAAVERGKVIWRTYALAEATALLAELDHAWADPPALEAHVEAVLTAAGTPLLSGRLDEARVFLARVEAIEDRLVRDAPRAAAGLSKSRFLLAMRAGDFEAMRRICEAATAGHERVGDRRSACHMRGNAGFACNLLGAYADAARLLRVVCAEAEQLGLSQSAANAGCNLGFAVAQLGALDEARALEVEAIRTFAALGDPRLEGCARAYLVRVLLLAGDIEGAEAEARRAVGALTMAPPLLGVGLAALAESLLTQGRVAEALVEAERGMALVRRLGVLEEGEGHLRVVHAEVLAASGDVAAARAAVLAARARLFACASKIADPIWRASFLERVPEHARTLALALELSPNVAPALSASPV